MSKTQILVVDDEPDLLAELAPLLERTGYSVATASDGQQALDLVNRVHPDLIVLDVLMPHVDGREVLRAVLAGCFPPHASAARLFQNGMTRRECCVLLLVDHLSLTYEEAAAVLRCSSAQIARRLALARHKNTNCDRILSRFPHVKDPNSGGG